VEDKIEGLETGADAYVEKPFELAYLDSVVKNLISQRYSLRKRFSLEGISTDVESFTTIADKFLQKVNQLVEGKITDSNFDIEALCSGLNMSRSQIFRKFKSLIDMSPSDYIRIMRLRKGAELLLSQDLNVNEVSYQVGFSSPSHFISSFKKFYKKTPKEYIQEFKPYF